MSVFQGRLQAELFAGMIKLAADASRQDALDIARGAKPYDRDTLVEFLQNLGKTFDTSAELIQALLDGKLNNVQGD